MQKRFQKLKIHHKTESGTNIHRYRVVGGRKRSTLNGVLIGVSIGEACALFVKYPPELLRRIWLDYVMTGKDPGSKWPDFKLDLRSRGAYVESDGVPDIDNLRIPFGHSRYNTRTICKELCDQEEESFLDMDCRALIELLVESILLSIRGLGFPGSR